MSMKQKRKQKRLKSNKNYLGHPLQPKERKAKKIRTKKVCTNACPVADLWTNCGELVNEWSEKWMCHNKTKTEFRNCRATCMCQGKIKN